ncbi:MAG: aspartate carbamoyltransferase regulatory subunit [Candidatus Thermoplasmatota archaeon]|jgi:aspartate carbamoyltransferase regulatory subunit|nr:aspartate carbamoyltransferase regulatory subunit [Candidatus Thermoplasmatota archaeon]MCL5962864.1 aspartate carbamoyltransferase regulatory subunit [Candidatus Thermoplasmatota archaeon]
MDNEHFKVTPIKNGTVIDHIPAGNAFRILKIIGIDEDCKSTVSILINVPSRQLGSKDIIKIEDRELDDNELNKIALMASDATINIIRDKNVYEKKKVSLPDELTGIIRCQNTNCISNKKDEKMLPHIIVETRSPLRVKCHYCDRTIINPQDAILF